MCYGLKSVSLYIYSKQNVKVMSNKKVIRITESEFHEIVKETVKKVLSEGAERQAAQAYLQNAGRGKVGSFLGSLGSKNQERGQIYRQGKIRELQGMIKNGSAADAMRKAKVYLQQGAISQEDLQMLQRQISSYNRSW